VIAVREIVARGELTRSAIDDVQATKGREEPT